MAALSPTYLAPAPRSVPAMLTIRLVLGGFTSQLGWLLVLFGLIFVWALDPGGAVISAVRFSGDLATAEGVVSGWRETNLSINEQRVFETRYDFEAGDGRRLSGVSYRTGGYLSQGERVMVEYVGSDPTISRIQGMRASEAGVMVSFILVFPLIGLILAVIGMQKGLKARRLMSTGQLALGTIKSKEPTNTRINNQVVYRLTFEFPAAGGGTFEVVGKSHRPQALEDEAEERLVYDPRNPSDAALLDELPCRPGIDQRGNFEVQGAHQAVLALLNLLAPGLAVLGYGAYILRR